MANLRLTPVRAYIPIKAKGGFVDLLVDDGCSVKEFRERVVLESKRTALNKSNFVVAGDAEGKRVFAADQARFLDPKHEMGFDLGSGKLEVYVRLTQDDWVNQYSALPPKQKREAPPLPEDVPSLPPSTGAAASEASSGPGRESIYHAFRKAKTGGRRDKDRDHEFETHAKRLRELLVYVEGLRRQVQAFEAMLRGVCLGCKTITETLAERLADDDREHSYTRMIMQAQNVASEEMGPGKADSLAGFLRGRLVGGLDELVDDLAARVGKVGHRNHLWREFDYYRAKVEDLQKKHQGAAAAAPKHQEKLARNQEKLARATEAFETYHAELLQELVDLWKGRHELLGPLLADWVELQQKLFVSMGRAVRRVPTEPNLAVADVSDSDSDEDKAGEAPGARADNPFGPGAPASDRSRSRSPRAQRNNPFGSGVSDIDDEDGDNPGGAEAVPVPRRAGADRSSRHVSRGSNPFDEVDEDGRNFAALAPSNNNPFDAVPASPKAAPKPALSPSAGASRSHNPFGDDDDDGGRRAEEEPGDGDQRYRDQDLRVLYQEVDTDAEDTDAGGDSDDGEPGRGPADPFRVVLGPSAGRPVSQSPPSPPVSPSSPSLAAPQPVRRPLPKYPNPHRSGAAREPPLPAPSSQASAAAPVVPARVPPPKPQVSPRTAPRRAPPPPPASSNPFD